jgi:hypothetical protein
MVVMHAYRGNQNAQPRVLYVHRSPVGLKVGRRPLENEVQEALEHTHPDLTFEWEALLREAAPARTEVRERPWRQMRAEGQARRQTAAAAAAAPPPSDDSLLARTVGAAEAGRLRTRYQHLAARVERRARTDEERARLIAELERLNPDEWADEAAIRAGAASADEEWNRIGRELPGRRRGRRGGRARDRQHEGAPAGAAEAAPEGSGIISGESEPNEAGLEEADAGLLGQSTDDLRGADDRDAVGADAAAGGDGSDGPGLSGRDGRHPD